jgi:hypothetical protein
MRVRLARLPQLLQRKIYKTGQTRGADDDEVYQNRVGRNSTVLVPFSVWEAGLGFPEGEAGFENGFIVLLSPEQYFGDADIAGRLEAAGLALGRNALVFYETREQWDAHCPDGVGWGAASRRTSPLGGQYVVRVPATTASVEGAKIARGFTSTSQKGAGIRVYEYASSATIGRCRLSLEALYWLSVDSVGAVARHGMGVAEVDARRASTLKQCEEAGLLDGDKLLAGRLMNRDGRTVCPLCLEEIAADGFFNRMAQAAGREVPDITITEVNLFHVEELRYGVFNHRPYNVGWGHHHCNVVAKDAGIQATLAWLESVLRRNAQCGAG